MTRARARTSSGARHGTSGRSTASSSPSRMPISRQCRWCQKGCAWDGAPGTWTCTIRRRLTSLPPAMRPSSRGSTCSLAKRFPESSGKSSVEPATMCSAGPRCGGFAPPSDRINTGKQIGPAFAGPIDILSRGRLGEVVADVAEDVLELTAQEDHGDDDSDGNDSNDECVFHQSLALVVTEECEHFQVPPFFHVWLADRQLTSSKSRSVPLRR